MFILFFYKISTEIIKIKIIHALCMCLISPPAVSSTSLSIHIGLRYGSDIFSPDLLHRGLTAEVHLLKSLKPSWWDSFIMQTIINTSVM